MPVPVGADVPLIPLKKCRYLGGAPQKGLVKTGKEFERYRCQRAATVFDGWSIDIVDPFNSASMVNTLAGSVASNSGRRLLVSIARKCCSETVPPPIRSKTICIVPHTITVLGITQPRRWPCRAP